MQSVEVSGYAPVPQPPDTVKKAASPLEFPTNYDAVDTIYMDLINQIVYLKGQAIVEYGDISLEADYIEYDLKKRVAYARGSSDSVGKYFGRPHFVDGSSTFDADSVRYNFDSKKCIIYSVKTQEGEGFLHTTVAQKQTNDDVHIRHGRYTTCNLDTPHYHFQLGKAIVKPNDKIEAQH